MSKIVVVKEFTFDSAHHLPKHKGKCFNLHGHTYKLRVGLSADKLNSDGMVVDFAVVKKSINKIIEQMDHHCLNDVITTSIMANFPAHCPTAEMMVVWLAEEGIPRVIPKSTRVEMVRLYETPTSYAEWSV